MTSPATPPEPGPVILYAVAEGVATITLNRPDVLNAFNRALRYGLADALDRAEADDAVNVVILTGAGRAFSAGGDMTESSAAILEAAEGGTAHAEETPVNLHRRIWEFPKPVIAAVRGHALGFAFELAAACDLTIAAEDAKFGEIQIRHGYETPVLISPFLVGLKHAKEVLLVGDVLTGADAFRMGIANRVVPGDTLLDEARALAQRIAANPAAPVARNKRLVNRVYELASMLAAFEWRDAPEFADAAGEATRDEATLARLRTLRDKGWEAFREERDTQHGR